MSDDYTLNLQQLVEMFPDMDREVVDMVLRDSAGLVDPAVNVLLNMNDLEYKPDEQEVKRQKDVELDAEYARRLAETEIAARGGGGRARSASASVGRRGPTASPPAHLTPPTAPAAPSSSSSKIRSMLRFGRRSGSRQSPSAPGGSGGSPLGSVPGSAPSSPLRVRNKADALESDFSDASESEPSSHREETPPASQQQQTDLIGLLDDSSPDLLYVPLSPSKLTPKPAAPIPSVSEDDAIDMNNPFAVQFDPLAVAEESLAGMSSLASVDESSDTNPFRARRHVGPPS
ncbi:hypothetical protein GGI13_000266 [Coemansia sp. RSA 455]|nr:hypothetical protein LPJ71_002206 [Coemansia sp. S17]KAJ2015085.1 hypothetical protein GGI14_004482 [Coemansia sp. S680]KAJ2028752.1 hypothetical protein H4S03_007712 [Coemansia sp. S3946]KAJ2051715.1 hypothetical protein H4S04_001811 [Coemansia sp. S16]KAJ2063691.1 hypothetical protein GGI08_002490 [Coemansia sp. S2]KAJ2094426.1 hypothetical protein GGI09_005410 [Coemansia sp. S100]KAJ2103094.1 hypothetical protein GGI16_003059 [Coemansia sp. S142-1]KAJ2114582.1 hypothetical protein IW14